MSDDADRAGDNTDKFEAAAIAFHSQVRKTLIPVGRCHYCNEIVVHGMLFCDTEENECAKDWEHEQARKKANGTA